MREVAAGAVLEARLLVDREVREVELGDLRNDVSVPEPAAAAALLEEVVDGVEDAPRVPARDDGALSVGRDLERVEAVRRQRLVDREEDARVALRLAAGQLLVELREFGRGDPDGLIVLPLRGDFGTNPGE